MEIYPYYTPPLELALELNIILDVDTLDLSDYSYIYGQLNHIILDFEIVNGFLERFKYLKKIKINNDKPNHLNNKFSIKQKFKKFIPRKLF